MLTITEKYTTIGGKFLTSEDLLQQKLKEIKAFVFDWDGVFNSGEKSGGGSSNFNEVDSMGTNLLRFNHYLNKKQLPITAIISGEKNESAFWFCKREHFNYSFFKFANKLHAINYICKENNIQPQQIAYFFDDVLDLSIARICGIRIFIPRKNNPSFNHFVFENQLADYVTAGISGEFAIRESCEMLMELSSSYNLTIQHRMDFTEDYTQYLNKRNSTETSFFTFANGEIIKVEN